MNAKKRTIYPRTDGFTPGIDDGDDFYTERGDDAPDSEPANSLFRKGRAAYAVHEEPAAPPRNNGQEGPAGGDRQEAPQEEPGDILAALADDALAAECARRICPQCPVKKDSDDARLRAFAELDNARKRLEREREEQIRFASEKVIADIIPALDNLDLALRHASAGSAGADFVAGVGMTRRLLLESLAGHGLVQVGEVGEAFDPAMHEAVGMTRSDEVPEGHVCALLSGGYKLRDRLLRPAKVMVSKAC